MATDDTAKSAATARNAKAPKQRPVRARRAVKAATANDFEGARQLLSRYCALIDRGKLVELSELFHPAAIFSVSFDNAQRHVGRAAILAWYTNFFHGGRGKVRHPRHKLFAPLLTTNGDTISASAYFDSDFVEANGDVRVLAGRYDDILLKYRGQWLFKERAITVCYHYSPGKGQDGMAC